MYLVIDSKGWASGSYQSYQSYQSYYQSYHPAIQPITTNWIDS